TSFDYELNLPTATVNPERKFSGQRFYHFQRKAANWNKISEDSDVIETNLLAYSAVGDLKIFRFKSSESELIEKPNGTAFYFIRDGKATVQTQSQIIELKKNNAITIPKTVAYQLFCSAETELIQLCF
ncbi:MAG: hypothetical protein KDD94_13915, partial [Calditrichaeota bacterium]|nr:hypothetical protein [Calditrichota bacterium]